MKLRRLLPPLVLVGVLGVIVYRAAEQPRRDEIQRHIRAVWEDSGSWGALQTEIRTYREQFRSPEDLEFAAHAYMRVRRPGLALRARWPDLERTLPAAEVRAFAEQSLVWLGWDDEPRDERLPKRRSAVYVQCMLALLEGGNARARDDLLERVHKETLDDVQKIMKRMMQMPPTPAWTVFADACRDRGVEERAAGRSPLNWEVAAALLAPKGKPYPEQDQDVGVLLGVVRSGWRTEFPPRWRQACRALGETGDPRAVEALREVAASLEGATDPKEQHDLVIVKLGLLAAGDWSTEPELTQLAGSPTQEMTSPRALFQEVVLARWRAGDPRARKALDALWEGLGAHDATARERLARNQLLGTSMPGPEVPVEHMLAGLEADGSPPALVVVAKAFRLRRGDPGARQALLLWVTGEQGEDLAPASVDPERALSAPISALRALYLY